MPSSSEPVDLLDLKMLPAWLKESAPEKNYEHYQGDEGAQEGRRPRGPGRGGDRGRGDRRSGPGRREGGDRGKRPTSNAQRPTPNSDRPGQRGPGDRNRRGGGRPHDGPQPDRPRHDRPMAPPRPLPDIAVRFVPHPPAFENVSAQIKESSVAYSLFALSRLFLEKPQRYDIHLAAKPEAPLFQLGEEGAISTDRNFLETNAFRFARDDFYKTEISQSEPIKGNFTSIARDRLSGMLLGPTNHHDYQRKLRGLYEQRFSRRMSFTDYQRQIEIASDPVLVEKWKEEARTITTFTTLREETPVSFATSADAEKHFRQTHLPVLVRTVEETTIDGVSSRNLADRMLNQVVENIWSAQNRSPSQVMPELAKQFREAGLHVFRHRRGMLFVSAIWPRQFVHAEAAVSPQVQTILGAVTATPGIGRKELADKMLTDVASEEAEARKLSLASDLHWLISAGYVIEFNDGSLDLPRAKAKATETEAKDSNPSPRRVRPEATKVQPSEKDQTPTSKDEEIIAATPEKAGTEEKDPHPNLQTPGKDQSSISEDEKIVDPASDQVGAIDPIAREEGSAAEGGSAAPSGDAKIDGEAAV